MNYVNFCLAVILSLLLTSGSLKDAPPSIGYYPGEILPDIDLRDMEGSSYKLSDYKGKKVVVNFWASWDARSRAINVRLHNYLRMNNADVAFLSISFDKNLNVLERTLAIDNLNPTSQFCEVNGTDSELFKKFGINQGFRNYLIDEEGVIKAINITPDDLKSIVLE